MARKRPAEELSTEELRRLLIERQRSERRSRLDHFRRTGRVIPVEPAPTRAEIDSLRSVPLEDQAQKIEEERKSKRKRWVDRLLLVVEVAAVLGLVWIAYTGFNVLRSLNREVSSVLQQPTLTPTPLIMAVVLPSGHTPPDSPGGARPNEAEIPEHLRPLVQSIADLPVPTPGPQQAIRLQIPAIKVDAPVVQGDGWEQLKKGVGQLLNTPDPGEDGNIVLSAHNDVFGEIFRHLDELQPGDEVILFTSQRTYTYVITDSQIVEPTQVEVIEPTSDPTLTLISCYPYMVDKKRIVVSASLKG
jgi:sortase A